MVPSLAERVESKYSVKAVLKEAWDQRNLMYLVDFIFSKGSSHPILVTGGLALIEPDP